VGSPGLGYFKDRFAGEALASSNPGLYEEYRSETPSRFLPLVFPEAHGLDGRELGEVQQAVRNNTATDDQKIVQQANIQGDRNTLKADSAIPATMAAVYLCLLLYFSSIGGYKPVHIDTGTELGTAES
jgi:hypothetical protein